MPLLPTVFANELDKFGNPDSPLFEKGPANATEAAVLHAAAFSTFMSGLVLPTAIPPGTHDTARAAMETALLGQDAVPPAGIAVINAAYLAYLGVIIAAVAPSGYVVATPPVPPGPIVAPVPPSSGSLAYATIVQLWCVAVTGSIPPAPPTPWV